MNRGLRAAEITATVRERKPLVHHITNLVVMNETANITLAAGALPVMAHALEEAAEMAGKANALVLNIGTLWPEQVDAMVAAGKRANEAGIPVIFDPVGAGATNYRTEVSMKLMENLEIALVRGNAAEISILAGLEAKIAGVEAAGGTASCKDAAIAFAGKYGCAAAVTGPVDIVIGNGKILSVSNGHEMMSRVTGTGCMATAVIGAYAAVHDDIAEAAAAALAVYGLSGEIAAREANGPGTFHALLYDSLANLTDEEIRKGARIDVV